MDPRTVLAERIDMGLRRHLGERVDTRRALRDGRYARDVLLVCEALEGTPLPLLARRFRAAGEHIAAERRAGRHAGPPQQWAADTSGFDVSKPPVAGDAPMGAGAPWWSPGRWLG